MTKTRFAPSPTGYLHIGSLRTALYCYLFARKTNGKFILRIEDTDQERYIKGSVENLLETLSWVGIEYDEGPEKGENGPYFQSQRTEIYKKHVKELIKNKQAYHCFCTKEKLEKMRENQIKNKLAPMYDRTCLNLPESEIQKKIKNKEPFVIRQKIPYEVIKFKDLIRRNVQFHGKTIDDQVLIKSDGFPTYHLANVVDDHLMKITHVIRGEEWLPSTPKHIALYKSFNWEIPEFAHLPLLLNPDRSKLSKRQGHVAVEDYIKEGYLKEAIINFTAFLGWNPGSGEKKEIFTLKELEENFSLEKVHKAGAIFNLEKLDWVNWQWKKQKHLTFLQKTAKAIDEKVKIEFPRPDQAKFIFTKPENENKFNKKRGEALEKICEKYLKENYKENKEKLLKILITIEEKILKNPKETSEHIDFYYKQPNYNKDLLTNQKMKVDYKQAKQALENGLKTLENCKNWDLNEISKSLKDLITKLETKPGQILWPIRSALSGLEFSPGAFETAWALGKDESLNRIKQALKKLNK